VYVELLSPGAQPWPLLLEPYECQKEDGYLPKYYGALCDALSSL
jgi:hypothetical protein